MLIHTCTSRGRNCSMCLRLQSKVQNTSWIIMSTNSYKKAELYRIENCILGSHHHSPHYEDGSHNQYHQATWFLSYVMGSWVTKQRSTISYIQSNIIHLILHNWLATSSSTYYVQVLLISFTRSCKFVPT